MELLFFNETCQQFDVGSKLVAKHLCLHAALGKAIWGILTMHGKGIMLGHPSVFKKLVKVCLFRRKIMSIVHLQPFLLGILEDMKEVGKTSMQVDYGHYVL
jgi:hypothetical protein